MPSRISSTVFCLATALAMHVAWPAHAQSPVEQAQLDALIAKQAYREAISVLEKSNWRRPEKMQWLRRQAEAGHVPAMYSLSLSLLEDDVAASLKWYARGRLARTLDAAECADPTASWGWRVNLDRQAREVAAAGDADARAFSNAIDDALAWDATRGASPSAVWICGGLGTTDPSRSLLPEPKRATERTDTRTTMEIKAKSVSDFYKAVEAGASAHFKYLNSGALIAGRANPPAGWLDNRRLLFVGTKAGEPDQGMLGSLSRRMLIWDTDTNKVEMLVYEADGISDLCVDGERVIYLTHGKGLGASRQQWLVSGRFPDLAKRSFGEYELRVLFMRSDCEYPPGMPSSVFIPDTTWLRRGDGYIVRHSRRADEPTRVVLHRGDGSTRELAVGNVNGGSVLAHAPFKDAYLLRGTARDRLTAQFKSPELWRAGDNPTLFWLYPSGKIEEVDIPYGVWDDRNPSSPFYRPTRAGIVLAGGDSNTEAAPGYAGLYLFEHSGDVIQLAAGPSFVAAISPDGCRVAYGNATDGLAARIATILKMVDVCRKE